MTLLKRHPAFLIVLALAAVLFLSDIWIYKDFVRAESYFALGSRLMVESGEWLTPHAPDELLLNKPPLTYWLIGISYKLFGVNYGSARLPSVLAALSVLAIIYALGVQLGGRRAGLVSTAILASSFLFMSFARLAMSDMLLALFVTAALACFIGTLSDRGPGFKPFVWLGYIALALGFLTKGPVAILLVAVPVGFELSLRRRIADVKRLRLIPGVLLFVIVAAPYFLILFARDGAGPLRFFFLGENLQRFTGHVYGVSSRPFWYELAAFFGDFAPWCIFVFAALWFKWRRPSGPTTAPRIIRLWLAVTLVLFSFSSFKLDYYLLPAMPASALIVAPLFSRAEDLPVFLRRVIVALLISCAVGIVAIALLSLKAAAVLSISTPLRFLPVMVASLGLVMVALAHRKAYLMTCVLAATICLTFVSMQWVLLPAFVDYLPPNKIANSVPAGSVLYTSRAATDWANSIAFSLSDPHKVQRVTGEQGTEVLLAALKADPKSLALITGSEYASLVAQDPGLRILAQAETFGHGGLSLNVLRNPRRDRLLLIGRDH